ncbi:MspA family porin [Nocardia sp. NPDC059091]|uniref:MspA family porin n=1 Tax=unclassified Nocardia TaxID=2637762 RepID=UPI0036A57993
MRTGYAVGCQVDIGGMNSGVSGGETADMTQATQNNLLGTTATICPATLPRPRGCPRGYNRVPAHTPGSAGRTRPSR